MMPKRPDHIGLLEHRFGRENQVSLSSSVGQELIDDHTEVEAAKRS